MSPSDDIEAACFEVAQAVPFAELQHEVVQELLTELTGSLPEETETRERCYHEIRALARVVRRIHQHAMAHAERHGVDVDPSVEDLADDGEPPDDEVAASFRHAGY